jgi:hypothetical protein
MARSVLLSDDADRSETVVLFKYLGHAHSDQAENREKNRLASACNGSDKTSCFDCIDMALELVADKPTRAKRVLALRRQVREEMRAALYHGARIYDLARFIEWCEEHKLMPLYLATVVAKHSF